MKSSHEIQKVLEEEKKRMLLQLYLGEKFKDTFHMNWLDSPENYGHLIKAFDFFYNLNSDNLELDAIGSSNQVTREEHEKQFQYLVALLDKSVIFSEDTPPVTIAFDEKEAGLQSLDIKQKSKSVSLRDLHAQGANLGVAEKFLNAELGQQEWLSEVDLERTLTKLGVRDKVHITRLNVEDIGMILHFEREKHGGDDQPYTIPLLINCGNSGSLYSQGSHWTEALITVNPEDETVTINYSDSMTAGLEVQGILEAAANYNEVSIVNGVEKTYTAFPDIEPDIHIESENIQKDGWSCGYRALYKLLGHDAFPIPDDDLVTPWLDSIEDAPDSPELREAFYRLLLSDLVIDDDYFLAMSLDKEAFVHTDKTEQYKLDNEFAKKYLELLSGNAPSKSAVTTEHFKDEYDVIAKAINELRITTGRLDSLLRLREGINKIMKDKDLSSDARIFALLDVFATEYNTILNSSGGSNSRLAKDLNTFCMKHFGVELRKNSRHLQKDGLLLRMLTKLTQSVVSEESLLPPIINTSSQPKNPSISAPVIGSTKIVNPTISPSVDSVKPKSDGGDTQLRSNKKLSRLGTMFGQTQFCYGEKPGGVEPGFRAIDLDETFFNELGKILPSLNEEKFTVLKTALESDSLKHKQMAFATLINKWSPNPHAKDDLDPDVVELCEHIKEAVSKNTRLSAWMYKLDYAGKGESKKRTDANNEAIREFVGTRLAGIFSSQNQKQDIAWVKGPTGPHALLACGWKNGLQELRTYLHGGQEPDYQGILVEDKKSLVKRSKMVPGLGKNLIFGIAIGDRDGIGKDAQNKGFAEGAFYGFDYGKPYEGKGVSGTLTDDFMFEDPGAGAPAIFRGTSKIGIARHFMYRNYSIFYDTPLSDRMFGVHLLRKMITGENPSEEVIKSYPGLRQELYRVQQRTPSTETLLSRLGEIRIHCDEGSDLQTLVDGLVVQIGSGKLSNFDHYFAEIKIDLIREALKTGMSYKELHGYLDFIDEMAVHATASNQNILNVFEKRLLLTKEEVDFIDKMEKTVSPTSVMSHDGDVFLNEMRIDPLKKRIPFQLELLENGTYVLSTTKQKLIDDLNRQFKLDFKISSTGLSCNLTSDQLVVLMDNVNQQYHSKRQQLLTEPTYRLETFPYITSLLNKGIPKDSQALVEVAWRSDKSLSFRLTVKTEAQAKMVQTIFNLDEKPEINRPMIVEDITPKQHHKFQQKVAHIYEERELESSKKLMTSKEPPKTSSKWQKLHDKVERTESMEEISVSSALINRYRSLISDSKHLPKLEDIIKEMKPSNAEKIMTYNDETLSHPDNIKCIMEDDLSSIKIIAKEIELPVVKGGEFNPSYTQ
ncbi:hypothetical protein [Legionella spiritensis]|uniref:hypothetical protein n=1 Tax=Legionella spiritensis TaxID=452 RepID=UPI000F6F220E|nr:hypothetical protein [Legionella spiritensis]VEG89943.1 Uncharacterised protein [Legionella spiritensis]